MFLQPHGKMGLPMQIAKVYEPRQFEPRWAESFTRAFRAGGQIASARRAMEIEASSS
jgi:hypothetical protein